MSKESMQTTATPETDAQTWTGHCGDGDWGKIVYAHWAQKLERERDEMIAKYAIHHAESEKLTAVIRAATILIAKKGRHNTMLAYQLLRSALPPENVKSAGDPEAQ